MVGTEVNGARSSESVELVRFGSGRLSSTWGGDEDKTPADEEGSGVGNG